MVISIDVIDEVINTREENERCFNQIFGTIDENERCKHCGKHYEEDNLFPNSNTFLDFILKFVSRMK